MYHAPFEASYTTGIVEEPTVVTDGREEASVGPPQALLASQEPFALRGCVITPSRKIENGYVVVGGDRIFEVGEGEPDSSVQTVDTGGVILPGLIDLHNHPEHDVFAPWEPPALYENRYQWRDSYEYARVIKTPWNDLAMKEPKRVRELTRYAEMRALVGGVTAIQGASSEYPSKEEALVRNVDLPFFGETRARSLVDLMPERVKPDKVEQVRADLDAGMISTFYVHLAEGVDEASRKELDTLIGYHLLREETVIIHGTALTEEQLGWVYDADAKLVWSPQSNLRLYGQTTRAAHALSLGIPVGLGADWLPSGSPSLLAELKVARRALGQQGANFTSKRLVEMVTSGNARIAKLEGYIGTLEAGRVADILVLERRREDPWENIVEADPSWVELVTLGGNPVYGRPDVMRTLVNDAEQAEKVLAWGKPMLLDTTYSVTTPAEAPALAKLRAILIDRFPQVGPIFA